METDMEFEFEQLSGDVKRRVLQERYEHFFAQAWSWYMNAQTLLRQRVPRARKTAQEHEVSLSMDNARKNLESMQITAELLQEYCGSPESAPEPLTLETMNDLITLSQNTLGHDGLHA